jgi:hypothetical protein
LGIPATLDLEVVEHHGRCKERADRGGVELHGVVFVVAHRSPPNTARVRGEAVRCASTGLFRVRSALQGHRIKMPINFDVEQELSAEGRGVALES